MTMTTPNDHVTRIAAELRGLGVPSGGIILVHSSFKSLGPVAGGLETVVRGLLEAVGPRGTLLMPALNWRLCPPEVFDPRTTPTIVGAIPEYFRARAGTLRSIHPTHSICGIGARAAELLADHHLDSTPCGEYSPLHKIVEQDARIVMLGCGLKPNTTMHALEEYAPPPYLFGPPCLYIIRGSDGALYHKEYRTHGFVGYAQRYDRVAELGAARFIRRGRVLQAETFVLDTLGLKEAVLAKLRESPLFFVDEGANG